MNKPPLNKWELLALIMWIVIGAFVWILETDAQDITAINCGGETVAIDAPFPDIVERYELINLREWRLPSDTKARDGLTRIVARVELSDGSSALLTLSGFLTVKYNAVAKGLIWAEDIPDWERIGDRNPHPDEYVLLNPSQVEALLIYC